MNAVLDTVDAGEDISNADAGTQAAAGGDKAAVPNAAGAGVEGQRTETAGTPAAASGASDDQSAAAGGASDGKDKLVPLAALHESREKIKALTSQIDELRAQPKLTAEDADLLKTLKEQRQAEKAPKDPEFLEDPKGYFDTNLAKAMKKLEAVEKATTDQSTARQQQEQVQALVGAVQAHEQKFMTEKPDYGDALTHVRTVRGNQLRLLHPQATDDQIKQAVGREELQAAHQILSTGGNPADFAYRYAQTIGYQPKAAATAQQTQATQTAAPDKSAVRTLGGGGGSQAQDEDEGDAMPEFAQALAERFGVKKRK